MHSTGHFVSSPATNKQVYNCHQMIEFALVTWKNLELDWGFDLPVPPGEAPSRYGLDRGRVANDSKDET